MIKKLLCTAILLLQTAYAETCPTIAEIQSGNWRGWQAIDINSGFPAKSWQIDQFKKNAAVFVLAAWMGDMVEEGPDSCTYDARIHDEEYLGIMLTKTAGKPDENYGNWTEVDFEIMRCDASIEDCRFEDS